MGAYGRARMRDANEPEIVKALEAAGATVTRLNEAGVPDLLVGYQGKTKLLEVKRPVTKTTGKTTGGATRPVNGGNGILTEAQLKWWNGDGKRPPWQGDPPVVVNNVDEALAAIGAPVPPPPPRALADVLDDPPPPGESVTTWRCSGCELVYDSTQGLDAYDANDVPLGVRPPMHWDDSKPDVRPLPLCAGFNKPGVRLA